MYILNDLQSHKYLASRLNSEPQNMVKVKKLGKPEETIMNDVRKHLYLNPQIHHLLLVWVWHLMCHLRTGQHSCRDSSREIADSIFFYAKWNDLAS